MRDPGRAGMLSWIGNQGMPGAVERALGHALSTPTTFLIVAIVAGVGLVVAARAALRSSVVLGLVVVEATEALASPVSWSHHYIWVVLLIAWLALAEDRPRAGPWLAAAVAVLLWAAPAWWVPHGPGVTFAGRGWLVPVADSDTLLCVAVVLGASWRVLRLRAAQPAPATTTSVRAPTSQNELSDQDERVTRQPVTTISFSGSPGR